MSSCRSKILIIGSGAREHAVGWKISQEDNVGQLYFAPGNAGTAKLGINVNVSATDIPALVLLAKTEGVDLTLALPDDPLALGIVDAFKSEGLKIWGPTRAAAELEWSKAYAKKFMKKYGIPTANYAAFTDYESAKKYVSEHKLPVVVKASGLALGKGVTVAQTHEEALKFLEDIFVNRIFGDAGNEVVIEEYLSGTEISIHALSDGRNYKIFPSSQDHKRIFDGNQGPNTGGMGVIAPLPFVDKALMERIEHEIVSPIVKGMQEEGRPFLGIIYPGIMLTPDGPKVFEINSRFGDPETQVYMRLLESSFLDLVEASLDGGLDRLEINWSKMNACNIALASGGYPGKYEKGKVITGISDAEKIPGVVVFHAGTRQDGENILTNGGRVLGVSAVGGDLDRALSTAYSAIEKINFEGMQYRKDIGKSALEMLK